MSTWKNASLIQTAANQAPEGRQRIIWGKGNHAEVELVDEAVQSPEV